jgi:hypothetical protein
MANFSAFDESCAAAHAEVYRQASTGESRKGDGSMRRKACALLLSATLGGCVSSDRMDSGPHCTGSWGRQPGPTSVPGVAGPHGQHLPMAAPYNMAPPGNMHAARQMMSNSIPLDMVQINRGGNAPGMSGTPNGQMPFTPMPAGGVLTPPGVPFAPGMPGGPNVGAGLMPNLGGGIVPANLPPGAATGGISLAQFTPPPPSNNGHNGHVRFAAQRTQVRFTRPTGMRVSWFAQGPDGKPGFSNVPLEAPARYNFTQGAIYRLKLSNIEGRPGVELYPTMEVVPANAKTEAFLAHSAVPIEFTQDDFKQIAEGNYVTKVIYLPDPQFQDVAGTGIDEIISTRLEPGADPIHEALRRGSILLIIRMGNVDQEAPNTPPLSAVTPIIPPPQAAPNGAPHGAPRMMVPYPGHMPGHGSLPPGLPPGGPMMAAPGNPLLPPPGFNPNLPPPPPGFAPGAPQFGSVPPPIPPSPGFAPPGFAPKEFPTTSGRIDDPLPPPIPPMPTPGARPTPDDIVPLVPPPVAPAPTGAKKADISVPSFPAAPPVAPSGSGNVKSAVTVPESLPIAPRAVAPKSVAPKSDTKNIEITVPPIPNLPSSKATDLPMATPAGNPNLPVLPGIDPLPVPAVPATPGTVQPTASTGVPPLPQLPPPQLPPARTEQR